MAANKQTDFDPTKQIDKSQMEGLTATVEYFIRRDPTSSLVLLKIIKENPKSRNKQIRQLYQSSMLESGWDPTVFEVPSTHSSRNNPAFHEAVNAQLSELCINGYITNNGRASYEILERGEKALESKSISLKGIFDLGKRVQNIVKTNPEMTDDELIAIYSERYGFEPNEYLKQSIIDSRYSKSKSGNEDNDLDSENDFDVATGMKKWAVFHEEYFNKMLEYVDRRSELREITDSILATLEVSLKYGVGYPENDIDPFTLISKIIALVPKRRKSGYELLKREFGLNSDVPMDINGVPIQRMDNSTFSFKTDLSWNYLKTAMDYKNDPSEGNKQRFVSVFNMLANSDENTWVRAPTATMALFWLDPYFYPTTDKKARDYYLDTFKIRVNAELSGEEYLEIKEQIRNACPDTDFRRISYDAYIYSEDGENRRNKNYFEDIEMPDTLSDEAELWFEILSDTTVSEPFQISLLMDFAKRGGSASYQELSDETAITPNQYEANLVNYGKKILSKYGNRLNIALGDDQGPRHVLFDYTPLPPGTKWRKNAVWTLKPALLEVMKLVCDVPPASVPPASQIKQTATPVGNRNTILYGPPGTGKTFWAKRRAVELISGRSKLNDEEYKKLYEQYCSEGKIRLVTFHQSYSYEDFICGIYPSLNAGDLSYGIRIGSFLGFCYPKLQNQLMENDGTPLSTADIESKYVPDTKVFIIDEINRGNVSSIFGELMTLIEDSKRLGRDDQSRAAVPSLGVEIGIPDDVFIIGTMNTADKSLVYLDAALRRRFRFVEMMPKDDKIEDFDGIKMKEIFNEINRRIELILDRDHLIGHSEFMKVHDIDGLRTLFAESIIPLLQDYFFEDYNKIIKVLSQKGKSNVSDFIDDKKDDSFRDGAVLYRITDRNDWDRDTFNRLIEVKDGQ